MTCNKVQYESGVVCVFTDEPAAREFGAALEAVAEDGDHSFALAYFSRSAMSAAEVVGLMAKHAQDLPYAACSTAGELTPDGIAEGHLVVIFFPSRHFQVHFSAISFERGSTIEDSVAQIAAARRAFMEETLTGTDGTSSFAICINDGLGYNEEQVTATLHWALEELPVLGGSAGDGLDFEQTTLILNGSVLRGGTILLLICCNLDLKIFKTENFVPTGKKLVVTRSDPARRIVYEFNAEDAAGSYAEIVGVDPQSLSPMTFASHPLVMRIGDEFYCRSIQKMNPDGSLSFFCAIDDGIVLTVAEPVGMADTTQSALDDMKSALGSIDFILGFDCVLRRVDAANRQVTRKISSVYRDNNVIGFNTYGEQYRSMHLNQTLTGIAFSGNCSGARFAS